MDAESQRAAVFPGRLDRLLGLPAYRDEDESRVARFVAVIATLAVGGFLVAAVLALVEPPPDWPTAAVLAVNGALCALSLWLLRQRSVAAGRVLFVATVAATTLIVFTGPSRGFDDIGMMLYPVLVIPGRDRRPRRRRARFLRRRQRHRHRASLSPHLTARPQLV